MRSLARLRPGVAVALTGLLVLGLIAPTTTDPVGAVSDPCAGMSAVPAAARPADLAERYDLDELHARGDDGRGVTAAVLQFGMSASVTRLREFQRCVGLPEGAVTQSVLQHGTFVPVADGDPLLPPPGGEAQSDVEVLTSTAPGLEHLYVLVSPLGTGDPAFYPTMVAMLDALRTGAATDGRRVDIVSLSYGACEADLPLAADAPWRTLDPALQALSEAGTWFFKGAGDAGSTDCTVFPRCGVGTNATALSVHFASSSPWVTSVGGLMFPDHAVSRLRGDAHVWNALGGTPGHDCSGGGGGLSTVFSRPDYQDRVPGGAVPSMRGLPDISGLAGAPDYLTLKPPVAPATDWSWVGTGGDSLAGPMYAGAFASLLTGLRRVGVTPPVRLNPLLYALALEPAIYASVFRDVVLGDNSLYPNLHGRTYAASEGYDLASGLGEVRLGALFDLLTATVPTPLPPIHAG